jgi:hypothetical protein
MWLTGNRELGASVPDGGDYNMAAANVEWGMGKRGLGIRGQGLEKRRFLFL